MWICVDIGKVGECKERRAIRLYVTKQIQMYPVLFEINYRNKKYVHECHAEEVRNVQLVLKSKK